MRHSVKCSTMSLISLIYIDKPDDVVCHGTLHKIADHDGVLVSFNLKSQKQSIKTKKVYDYNNADIEGLIKHIKTFDFESVVFSQEISVQADIYSEILKQTFDILLYL